MDLLIQSQKQTRNLTADKKINNEILSIAMCFDEVARSGPNRIFNDRELEKIAHCAATTEFLLNYQATQKE